MWIRIDDVESIKVTEDGIIVENTEGLVLAKLFDEVEYIVGTSDEEEE